MLDFETRQTIGNTPVFSDDRDPHLFYVLPTEVDYQRSDDGTPLVKLVLYRFPIDTDPIRQGGYCLLEAAPIVPEDELMAVQTELRSRTDKAHASRVRVQIPDFEGSTAQLLFLGTSAVAPVEGGAARFSLDLDRNQATLLHAAINAGETPFGVVFDLRFKTLGPAVRFNLSFDADRFFETNGLLDNLRSSVKVPVDRETVLGSGAGRVELEYTETSGSMLAPMEVAEEALISMARRRLAHLETVRTWTHDVYDALQQEFSGRLRETEFAAAFAALAGPVRKTANFEQSLTHRAEVDRILVPQGMLQPFGSDHVSFLDLEHYILEELSVFFLVDFTGHSSLEVERVDINVRYRGETTTHTISGAEGSWRFRSTAEESGSQYSYWCTVHLAGESSPISTPETDSTQRNVVLRMNPSELGRFILQTFYRHADYIEHVDVELEMTHPILDKPLQRSLRLDQNSDGEIQTTVFDLGKPYDPHEAAYRFRATHKLVDAPALVGEWGIGRERVLGIVPPFTVVDTLVVVAFFQEQAATVSLVVEYKDEERDFGYTRRVELSNDSPNADVQILRLKQGAGIISYRGQIDFGDSQQQIESTDVQESIVIIRAAQEHSAD